MRRVTPFDIHVVHAKRFEESKIYFPGYSRKL